MRYRDRPFPNISLVALSLVMLSSTNSHLPCDMVNLVGNGSNKGFKKVYEMLWDYNSGGGGVRHQISRNIMDNRSSDNHRFYSTNHYTFSMSDSQQVEREATLSANNPDSSLSKK